jgi:hypothetical protein
MALGTSAAPDDVLDALNALGASDDVEEIEGEGEETSPEEIAEPEEVEGEEADQEPEESDEQPEEEAPEEEVEETEEEPDTQTATTGRTQARIQALAAEAKRAARFKPILDILEEDPNLAREVVGRKLGLVPAESRQAQPQVQQAVQPQQQATKEQLQAYWTKRFSEDFAGAMAEMMDLKLKGVREESRAAGEPAAVASFKSVVRSFKADLQSGANSDDQFEYYEPYFDALLKSADRNYVMSDPDTTLSALRDLAYGKWANDQRSRAKKAATKTQAAGRANPRRASLATAGGGAPRRAVKTTRPLNDAEKMLAERYGLDLVTPDEDEPESAWR